MATEYHIYTNTGAGDPINYATPAATVNVFNWASAALSYPGTWSFAVRAFDTVSTLEEQNVDCVVTIVLDGNGEDVTDAPPPPSGLRAFPQAGGSIRAEWYYPLISGPKAPTGFHVYTGAGGSPAYTTPAAIVPFSTAVANTFVVNMSGFTDGATYAISVRAYNATAEETNINSVSVTAVATGPAPVDSLAGIATAQA